MIRPLPALAALGLAASLAACSYAPRIPGVTPYRMEIQQGNFVSQEMVSQLKSGMSREQVLPPVLGRVHPIRQTPYAAIAFTTLLAFALITFVGEVPALGGTTALLLLCVFTVVNIALLVLRRDRVDHQHFRTPTVLPVLGALTCGFLAGPWTGRDPVQYTIAGILIGIGIVLWVVTVWFNRAAGRRPAEPSAKTVGTSGPVN